MAYKNTRRELFVTSNRYTELRDNGDRLRAYRRFIIEWRYASQDVCLSVAVSVRPCVCNAVVCS